MQAILFARQANKYYNIYWIFGLIMTDHNSNCIYSHYGIILILTYHQIFIEDVSFNIMYDLYGSRLRLRPHSVKESSAGWNFKYWIVSTYTYTRICDLFNLRKYPFRQTCWVYHSPCWTHAKKKKTLKKFANPFWNITSSSPHKWSYQQLWKRALRMKTELKIPEYIIRCQIVGQASIIYVVYFDNQL